MGEGRVGMWFAWGLYGYGPDSQRLTLGMAVPPLAQAALDLDDVPTSGMYISPQTDKQQACWAWLKYLSATPGPFTSFPARRSNVIVNDETHPYLLAIALAIMLIMSVSLLIWAKRKGWW